jgi:ureidoacrylate peracid hydrolase
MPPVKAHTMNIHRSIHLAGRYYRAYPPDAPLGYAEDSLELKLDETVFLLVDVYGRGFDPGDDLGSAAEFYKRSALANKSIVVDHIAPAKAAARAAGLPIVYLTNYLSPAMNEHNEWRHMSMRTAGIDVLEAWREPNDVLTFSRVIAPQAGDYLITKQLYSGFFETHLDSLLRSLNARNLVAVGFDSRICLGTTVIDAMYRNYRVIVLRDCTATTEYVETEAQGWANWMAIRFIETCVGYTATAADWIGACQAVAPAMVASADGRADPS